MDADTYLVRIAWARKLARSGRARAIRQEAGITLGEVADRVGVTVSTICKWEAGQRKPTGEPAALYGELLDRLYCEANPKAARDA